MPRLVVPAVSVVVAILVAACNGPTVSNAPSASPEPVASASPIVTLPTQMPSPTPLPTPTSTPGPSSVVSGPSPTASTYVHFPEFGFVDTFVVRVLVNDLNVRRKPDTSGVSDGKARKGQLFMMYDWPISADGYTWYYGYEQLQSNDEVPKLPQPYNDGYDEILGGWMAFGTEDTPFVLPVGPRCPTVRNTLNVAAMLGSERVACFGSDSLQLDGEFGCGICQIETEEIYEPLWLAAPSDLRLSDLTEGLWLTLFFPPDGPAAPAKGSKVRVTGHFSDDRSSTCRITVLGPGGSIDVRIDHAAAEQSCRSKFVVDSWQLIP